MPVLNLWRPKEVINDVWRSGGTVPPTTPPQEFPDSAVAYLISDGLDVPMALLAIVVAVKGTQRIEIARDDTPRPREVEERFERADDLPATTRNEDGTFPSYPG